MRRARVKSAPLLPVQVRTPKALGHGERLLDEARGPHLGVQPQITRDIHIDAPTPNVWAILADSRALPKWAPLVHEVEACSATGEAVGATRTCRASIGNREGRMVERVVAIDPGVSVTYAVDEDTFGMNRMFDGYGFRLSLAPDGDGTRARIETYYTPRNPVVFAMNALFMRRQMRSLVDQLLGGLRAHAESLL